MRKISLFIASSLDGYIARKDHSIDWLFTDGDYGFFDFYDTVDITLMGNKTYEIVKGFGEFPYKDRRNYVFTKDKRKRDEEYIKFINDDIAGFVSELKKEEGGTIWLIGGGEINRIIHNAGLIDEYIISVHPIMLGDGISMFPGILKEVELEAVDVQKYDSGLVSMKYLKK